jgi:hypothetical protein
MKEIAVSLNNIWRWRKLNPGRDLEIETFWREIGTQPIFKLLPTREIGKKEWMC